MSNDTIPTDIDPEDMFKDTRMSIGDHIEDLRAHLLRALMGLGVGMIFGFWPLGPYVLELINAPVVNELTQFEIRKLRREEAKKRANMAGVEVPINLSAKWVDRRQLANVLGLDPDKLPALDTKDLPKELKGKGEFVKLDMAPVDELGDVVAAQIQVIEMRNRGATSYNITEMFFVYMKISFFTGLVLSSPWVFYHLWMFIAAGLYPNEKRLVNVYLPFSVLLFLAGVVFCEVFAMRQAVKGLLLFNEWLGIDAEIRLQEWLSFAIMMPLVFGLAFQTPLVMMFLHRVGLVTVPMLRHYRRISWFVLAIVAALLAPAPTADGMLLLWVPLVAFYELGILLCVWQGDQNRLLDFGTDEAEKSEEFVEV
jgi:sec-independent protein translocase protein TatC